MFVYVGIRRMPPNFGVQKGVHRPPNVHGLPPMGSSLVVRGGQRAESKRTATKAPNKQQSTADRGTPEDRRLL